LEATDFHVLAGILSSVEEKAVEERDGDKLHEA
jgi:hypothetical protein